MAKDYDLDNKENEDYSVTFHRSYVELTPGEGLPRKKNRRLIVIVGIAVVVIAVSVGLAVGLTRKDETEAENQPVTATQPTLTGDWLDAPCFNPSNLPTCPWKKVNPVLLISTDGFYADYLRRNITPVLDKLQRCGVHTPYMRSVYPTNTLPNHYSIATGLFPAYSGIVDNSMYDPVLNKTMGWNSPELGNPDWWGGEPLWVTATKQGLKAASYFWIPVAVAISGVLPDKLVPLNTSVPLEERIDTVLDWLSLDEDKRPDFIALYLGQPDSDGHKYGPHSIEVNTMVARIDDVFHRLMNGLFKGGLEGCVNVMVVSDHGMSESSVERQVSLEHYLPDVDDMLVVSLGSTASIRGKYKQLNETVITNENGKTTEEIVAGLECKNLHLKVFTNSTMPTRFHYTHERLGDVMLKMDDRWIVTPKPASHYSKGDHGYDNAFNSMQAVFVAHGPAFKQNFKAEPFDNIELYNIITGILDLDPAPNNGTPGSLSYILQDEPVIPDLVPSFSPSICRVLAKKRQSSCSCGLNVTYATSPGSLDVFPFGEPTLEYNLSMCKLAGNQFTSFYSWENKQPVLTSFVLGSQHVKEYNTTSSFCINPDPRLSDKVNPDCTMYENTTASIIHTQLYDPGLSTTMEGLMDSQLSSNILPMYKGFKDGIWHYLWRLIREYALTYKTIHVSLGPVFDANFDGRMDGTEVKQTYVNQDLGVPLPSHYYAILMKCSENVQILTQCKPADLQTLAFVLPHLNRTTNCLSDKEYLEDNVVRIRDIEVLTGFRFLSNLDQFLGARKRTVLQTDLWSTALLTPWVDLPCPIPDDTKCQAGNQPVLLISLDGFRADYVDRHLTPVIQRLAQCGVHSPYMRSVYPTVTFPNHYTIVTGLYPESHGIVLNTMYDEEIDKIFSLSAKTAKDPRWWKGEPIWTTAMKQNKKTATYFWPGSDVNISGMYPDIYKPYDGKAGYTSRVYEVLDWLTMPADTRPDLITLYFDEPDHAGHNSGPISDEVNGQLETVDELLNLLMTNLYEKGLHNCVNIIVIADHGMANQSCDRKVMLKDFIPDVKEMLVFDRTMGNIYPQFKADGRNDAHRQNTSTTVDDIVTNLTCRHSAMKAFTKDTLPRRHHYTNNPRIGNVIVDMRDEWIVLRQSTNWCTGGNHGWDNTYKNMHALFLAHGPAFKTNFTTDPFENIELYNLMAELLNITPAPNNGTQGSLSHILRDPVQPVVTPRSTVQDECNKSNDSTITTCGCHGILDIPSALFMTNNKDPLLFGVPSSSKEASLCLLHQPGSSAAYSHKFKSPVWLITTVTSTSRSFLLDNSSCIGRDNRVSGSTTCTAGENNITMASLMDLGIPYNDKRVYLSSTMIPMYDGFISGIWKTVKELIVDYSQLYGDMSVMSGPLYDYNNDGLQDDIEDIKTYLYKNTSYPIPLPSHIYVSLIKCKVAGESLPCTGGVDVMSVILPHTQHILNCLSPKAYLKDNVARLRDIELLSGVQFMTSYNVSYAARLRTYLPEALWKSTLFNEWKDMPCPHSSQCTSDYKPLLLISLDGFRADYLLRNMTPTIARLSQCGVHAPYMRSVYPTKTFPNHYSIVTGLYPESHGIIDNNMYDVTLEQRFSLGSPSSKDPRWWGGEPIWLTAKKQGRKTATFFWPGSDVKIQGDYPDYWRAYDGKVTYYERVQEVLTWMTLPDGERPEFITLYFDEPDLAGHKYGPDGQGVGEALQRVDDTVNLLMEGLMERNLHNCVNLVVIADHGMAGVSCDRMVRLVNYVDSDYLNANTWVWEGPFGRIANTYTYNRSSSNQISPALHPAPTEELFTNLTCASPHLDLYRKASLPVRHHYSNNDRIDDIILDLDSDWLVTRSYAKSCRGGKHGYDNIEKSMEALFLAYGPAFKWNMTVDAFENIELYNMFTEILNVTAAPNNGTMGSLNHLLQSPPSTKQHTLFSPQVTGHSQYPNTDVYLNDVTLKSTNCEDICKNLSPKSIEGLYRTLTSTGTPTSAANNLPRLIQKGLTDSRVTVIHHTQYTVGYDEDTARTLWIKSIVTNNTKMEVGPVSCIIPDPHIHNNPICYNDTRAGDLQFGPLLLLAEAPNQFEHSSTLYTVMLKKFIKAVWRPFQGLLLEWSVRYGDMEVISGPVYDHDHDSLPDNSSYIRRPSHFYTIISRCLDIRSTGCKTYQTFSVILPHTEEILNCKTIDAYLEDNECRIRDIELITGLQFFTELPPDEAARLRVYLPNGLWP